MRDRSRITERGQTTVLVALLMVGLLAATGLAIDGGMTMKMRRDAQNAADAGALRGAQEVASASNDNDVYHSDVLRAVNDLVERNGVEDTNGNPGDDVNDHVTAYLVDENGDVLATLQPGGPKVSDDATGVAVEVSFEGPPSFIQVVGVRELPAQASSLAQTKRSSGVWVKSGVKALSHVDFKPYCSDEDEGECEIYVLPPDDRHSVHGDWVSIPRYIGGPPSGEPDEDVWYKFELKDWNTWIKFEDACNSELDNDGDCKADGDESDGLGDGPAGDHRCEIDRFTIELTGDDLGDLAGFDIETFSATEWGYIDNYLKDDRGTRTDDGPGFRVTLVAVEGSTYTFDVDTCDITESVEGAPETTN